MVSCFRYENLRFSQHFQGSQDSTDTSELSIQPLIKFATSNPHNLAIVTYSVTEFRAPMGNADSGRIIGWLTYKLYHVVSNCGLLFTFIHLGHMNLREHGFGGWTTL